MIISCGSHERIGIRDRAFQTLYISDIIEPDTCQEPAYGELQIGLFYAIVKDAMERQELRNTESSNKASFVKKKRSIEDVESPTASSKRTKTSRKTAKQKAKDLATVSVVSYLKSDRFLTFINRCDRR